MQTLIAAIFGAVLIAGSTVCVDGQHKVPTATRVGRRQADTQLKFKLVPIDDWVGIKVVFLHSGDSNGVQLDTYSITDDPDNPQPLPDFHEVAGKVGRVVAFPGTMTIQVADMTVSIKFLDYVPGVVLLSDLETLRAYCVGKVFWYKDNLIVAANGSEPFVSSRRFQPVTILAVATSDDEFTPFRFLVRTSSGKRGYIDLSAGPNNIPGWGTGERFEDALLIHDPRSSHHWSSRVWAAIEEGTVYVGMSPEQARWSWGKPKEINTTITRSGTSEQWVYSSGNYLYFDDGILTSIQD